MFTGIITDIGRVRSVERAPSGDTRLAIDTGQDVNGMVIGASVACSGACLTVVELGARWFAVEFSGETRARTTLGDWQPGRAVNLERPLRIGDELGGHLVSGHIDGVALVERIEPEGGSLRFILTAPRPLAKFIAPKGSVALDGVSLTVNEVEGDRFGVNVIDHTRRATSFGEARPGERMNLEVDILARYVARLAEGA
jgi:riboflavin synthase